MVLRATGCTSKLQAAVSIAQPGAAATRLSDRHQQM